MAAVGGSVISANFSGRPFNVTADADISQKLGGFENTVEANGNATTRLIKTRVTSQLGDLVLSIDDANGDFEFLQELANSNELFDVSIELASGAIWAGTMQFTGEMIRQTNATTASVSLNGAVLKQL